MVTLLRSSLTDDVRVAALLRAGAVEDVLVTETSGDVIRVGDSEEEFVQVLDSRGEVVASSANIGGEPALTRLAPGQSRTLDDLPLPEDEDEPFLVVATAANGPDGRLTILVGQTLETVTESSQVVVNLLATGLPLVLVVVAVTTWRVVGRALAPVEAIRAEVNAISSAELHRRVPEPEVRDEIARLASTMNEMLARLEEGQARERRFVSDASHELRSPVAAIRQHAEVALKHPERANTTELAEVVLEEDLRLQRVVEDLLLLTSMDEGRLRQRRAAVDLDDLLLEEAARLRDTTDLRIDSGGVSAARVSGDIRQLRRLVRNLVDNAARHTRTAVVLSLTEASAEAVLRVDDDGVGIPAGERRRIFDRFVRLDEARDRDSGGAGLGLAIVAEVAAAHGGSVEALDSPIGGARLEVRLHRLED
jgi:signal transduction histidine kinase